MKRLSIPLLLTAVFLLFFRPEAALSGAVGALRLAGGTVIPALFPFFFLSSLFSGTPASKKAGALLSPVMKPLFGVSGAGALPLLWGLLGGYPVGARVAAALYRKGELSAEDYARLAGYTNNSGPLFIVGAVGVGMLGSARAGFLLLISHILAALTAGLLFRRLPLHIEGAPPARPEAAAAPMPPLSHAMDTALWSSLTVGGYIVLFGTFLSIFDALGFFTLLSRCFPLVPSGVYYGFFEMTAGLSRLSSMHSTRTLMPLAGLLIGWGGLSVHMQAASLMSADAFFPATYWWGKALSAALTALYASLFARLLPDALPTLATGIYPEIITPRRLTVYLIIYLVTASLLFRYFATRKR